MIGKARHIPDDRLFDCYLAMCAGDVADPLSAEHLADCPVCRGRYEEMVAFMDDIQAEGRAEVDELFTADGLSRQRQQILSTIDHLHRPARVISFPAQMPHQAAPGVRHSVPRWLTAAAVVGLFMGIGIGGTLFERRLSTSERTLRATATTPVERRSAQPAVLINHPAPVDDDAFLVGLEVALERSYPSELQPFDALTPHARKIGSQLR